MDKNLVLLEYKDNFADNFSVYAYGKIAQEKFNALPCRQNSTNVRKIFEDTMKDFNLKNLYVSNNRVNEIVKKSQFMDYSDFNRKNLKKDRIIGLNHFKTDDIEYITDDIINDFKFNNLNFIKNYDILETINTTNSIGLYINEYDEPDYLYIENALKRLNKYIKQPKLYVFCKCDLDLNSPIPYEILNSTDWREEFYFLMSCKHKIIHCSEKSYSEGFWAAILSKNKFGYVVINKNHKTSKAYNRWISL